MAHSLPGQHCLPGLEDGLRVLHHRPPAADDDPAGEEGVSRLLRRAGALAEEEDMAQSSDDEDSYEADHDLLFRLCVLQGHIPAEGGSDLSLEPVLKQVNTVSINNYSHAL